jgi:hypothetical protein
LFLHALQVRAHRMRIASPYCHFFVTCLSLLQVRVVGVHLVEVKEQRYLAPGH